MSSVNAKKQRGFALLTVLLIVAMVSMVSSQMLYDQQVNISRSGYMIQQAQTTSVAFGFESWVKKGLKADLKDNKFDHLNEIWAQPLPPVKFAGGLVSGELIDLQSKINLNNVLEAEETRRTLWKQIIERSFTQTSTQSRNFNGFSDVLTDWVDKDDEALPYGAESATYLLENPAFRTANQALVMSSEIKVMSPFNEMLTNEFLAQTQHISTLPKTTTININTADMNTLKALSDWLTEEIAKSWIEARQSEPAESVNDFLSFLEQSTGFTTEEISESLPAEILSVNSQYFQLKASIELGEVSQNIYSIFYREDENNIQLIQRWLEAI